jgi:hypothetical protein
LKIAGDLGLVVAIMMITGYQLPLMRLINSQTTKLMILPDSTVEQTVPRR